jgi:crossover junction endodeoxyribonuclease RusA
MGLDPETLTFTLGYPPTGNTSVRHGTGGHWLSPKANAYFALTRFDLMRQGVNVALTGRLKVEVEISPPDKRARDLDNAWKTAGDACTRAGVWLDDSQIDWLVLRRLEPVKGGRVRVTVTVLDTESEGN